MRTKPLIPETCFATTTEEDSDSEKPAATPYLEEDGTSLLISCSSCGVRVHTSQCPAASVVSVAAAVYRLSPSLCLRLLRRGPGHRQQGLEVCSLQGQRHRRGQDAPLAPRR